MPQNEEDISYMFDDETTPVKACGDLAYHVGHSGRSLHLFLFLSLICLLLSYLSVMCNPISCAFYFVLLI